MALFTKDTIDRVRDAVDMVHLVGQKTDLRRVGTRWSGLCPFHDERTPSFSVNPEEKLYYCFGCGEGGDAFKFVQQTEALDFQEAVELLAERSNVRVEREDDDPRAEERRRRRERLHALLDRAAASTPPTWPNSAEAAPARDYLASRGLSDEVLARVPRGLLAERVGPDDAGGARRAASARRSWWRPGLAQRGKNGGLYDRFRGRIMFPLADSRGKVLGFGARQMGEGRGPKYLNTSENDLYHKGRQLFGIDVARKEAMQHRSVRRRRGLHRCACAPPGGDSRGRGDHGHGAHAGAARRAGEGRRREPSRPCIPRSRRRSSRAGCDAARGTAGGGSGNRSARSSRCRRARIRRICVTQEGSEAFGKRMERAVPMIEFQVRRVLADADLDTPAGRDKALGEARELISAVPERTATRDALVREAADRLDVPVDYVLAPARAPAARPDAPTQASPAELSLRWEREFLISVPLERGPRPRLPEQAGRRAVLLGAHAPRPGPLRSDFDDPAGDPAGGRPAAGRARHRSRASRRRSGPPRTSARLNSASCSSSFDVFDREIRRASQDGELGRQTELAAAEQSVRKEMGSISMGQTA